MHTVRGSFKVGVAKPDEPVQGHEGQPVLITFLDDSQKVDASTLENLPTPEEVVARIAASGPDEDSYIPPTESLAEALSNGSLGVSVDPAEWDRQWAEIEAEINRVQREDDRAEGHRWAE